MLIKKLRNVYNTIKTTSSCVQELLWAKTWDDTKSGIEWMKDLPSISPGRWAVGYNYLYVMTRILNEIEPECVLDMGLGISSTLISQYFSHRSGNGSRGIHDIIEQDPQWASFYLKKHSLSDASRIYSVPCVEKEYRGCSYNAYSDIGPIVRGKKYHVISVDGPIGSSSYSRRDILEYLPDILCDRFAIVLDDTDRTGERATVEEIMTVLESNGISCCKGNYPGSCNCTVIVSSDLGFLCSM